MTFWFRNYIATATDTSVIRVTGTITCMKDKYKEDYIRTQDIFKKLKLISIQATSQTQPFIRTASTMSCSVV